MHQTICAHDASKQRYKHTDNLEQCNHEIARTPPNTKLFNSHKRDAGACRLTEHIHQAFTTAPQGGASRQWRYVAVSMQLEAAAAAAAACRPGSAGTIQDFELVILPRGAAVPLRDCLLN
jgi:hypothetical protein